MTWVTAAASVAGTSHQARRVPCQDAHAHWSNGRVAVLAVADGAGSAPFSAIGARAAVTAAVDHTRRLAARGSRRRAHGTLTDLFGAAQERVHLTARALGVADRALATTLVVALATRDEFAVAQIGDGIAVVATPDGLRSCTVPSRGEYANETMFLTSRRALDSLAVEVMPRADVRAIALTTDGLQLVALENRRTATPYEPFFDDVFAWLAGGDVSDEAIAAFLTSVPDRTGDDKTLLLARPATS